MTFFPPRNLTSTTWERSGWDETDPRLVVVATRDNYFATPKLRESCPLEYAIVRHLILVVFFI